MVIATKRYSCKAVGYDIDPQRVKESRETVARNKVAHLVTIEQKDIFTVDLSKADVVCLYLLPRLNARLVPRLEKLKPGSRIVSHLYEIPGIEPDRVISMVPKGRTLKHMVYLWIAPLKRPSRPSTVR